MKRNPEYLGKDATKIFPMVQSRDSLYTDREAVQVFHLMLSGLHQGKNI